MALQFTTLFGGAMALGGAAILLLGLRHVWRAGTVLRAPAAGTDDDSDAQIVRLDGTVTDTGGDGPIEAPFSGTASVVVRHVVAERQLNPSVPILPWYVTIGEGTGSAPFEVRTPETTATVDGAIGSAILGSDPVATVGVDETPPERVAAYHERSGLATEPLVFGSLPGPLAGIGRAIGLGTRTYSEERLAVGDETTIVGYPVDGSAEASGADAAETVDPLVVSDRSPRRTFLAMAKTGLVAGVLGIGVLAIGLLVLLI